MAEWYRRITVRFAIAVSIYVLNRAALCICIKNPKGNIKESDADKNLLLIDCRILEGTVNRKRLLFDVFGSKIEKS